MRLPEAGAMLGKWDRRYFAALFAIELIAFPLLMARPYLPASWSDGIISTVPYLFLVAGTLMVVRYAVELARFLIWVTRKLVRR